MKYRCLTDEELKELENEFKHFLISNNVYTEEWENLNKTKSDKVQVLVEMFSDLVMDKALKNIKFLEHITVKDIKVFYCENDKMTLIGITSNNEKIDFTNQNIDELKNVPLNIFKTDKKYNKQRELEIFDLLNSGCSIIDESRYKKMELAHTYSLKQNKN